MADRRAETIHADLADVVRALLIEASPELFGSGSPAVTISVSGEVLRFPIRLSPEAPRQLADTSTPGPDGAPHAAGSARIVRTFVGSGESVLSLSGLVARVRRARDLAVALLATDADRVLAGSRFTTHESAYATSHRLTGLALTAVETQLAGDAATARISLHLEAELEVSRLLREGEEAAQSSTGGPEAAS